MSSFFDFLSYLGIFSLLIPIISLCLLWLFIRSAIASGTKQGIIDAYNTLSGKEQQQLHDDFEEEMRGWE